MLTRRKFFKGLLATVAAAALVKNGIIRPEQIIAKPEPWTIDMAANTWRQEYNTFGTLLGELPPLRGAWPMTVYVGFGPGAYPAAIGRALHIDPIGDQVIVQIRPLG